jgi:hypothetical protein
MTAESHCEPLKAAKQSPAPGFVSLLLAMMRFDTEALHGV